MEINTVLNIITIFLMLVGATIGAVSVFFLRRHFTDYDDYKKETKKNDDEMQKDISEVKLNYIERFEILAGKVNDTREHLTKSINDSEKNLTKLITDSLKQ